MEPPPLPASSERPGFQSASSIARSHVPSTNSNRNASGGQPPLRPAAADKLDEAPVPAAGPYKPVNRPVSSRNAIVHSVLQRRNPVLPLIRNVGLEIGDIVADYQVGAHSGMLFLSLKYHRLHPEYIHGRIEKMRNVYNLRILLILCDINEHQQPIRELSKVAVVNDLTVIVAFSNEEAAQYLTTFKSYEHKSANSLKERVRQTYPEQLEHVLTSGRKVNKANVETLVATFGSFANMVRKPSTILTGVKGIGPTKTLSLYRAFNEPFVAGGKGKATLTRAGKATLARRGVLEAEAAATAAEIPDSGYQDDEEALADADGAQHGAGMSAGRKEPISWETRHSNSADNPADPAKPQRPDRPAISTPPTPRRPVDDGPSRSPSVEADEEHTATKEVWHDPLADEDDDEEEGEDERPAKRARM